MPYIGSTIRITGTASLPSYAACSLQLKYRLASSVPPLLSPSFTYIPFFPATISLTMSSGKSSRKSSRRRRSSSGGRQSSSQPISPLDATSSHDSVQVRSLILPQLFHLIRGKSDKVDSSHISLIMQSQVKGSDPAPTGQQSVRDEHSSVQGANEDTQLTGLQVVMGHDAVAEHAQEASVDKTHDDTSGVIGVESNEGKSEDAGSISERVATGNEDMTGILDTGVRCTKGKGRNINARPPSGYNDVAGYTLFQPVEDTTLIKGSTSAGVSTSQQHRQNPKRKADALHSRQEAEVRKEDEDHKEDKVNF